MACNDCEQNNTNTNDCGGVPCTSPLECLEYIDPFCVKFKEGIAMPVTCLSDCFEINQGDSLLSFLQRWPIYTDPLNSDCVKKGHSSGVVKFLRTELVNPGLLRVYWDHPDNYAAPWVLDHYEIELYHVDTNTIVAINNVPASSVSYDITPTSPFTFSAGEKIYIRIKTVTTDPTQNPAPYSTCTSVWVVKTF